MRRGFNFSKAFLDKFGWVLGRWWDAQWRESTVLYPYRGGQLRDIKGAFDCLSVVGESLLVEVASSWSDLPNDEKMAKIRDYVNNLLHYDSDINNYGKVEYWAPPDVIFKGRWDDCDGFAVLMCKLGWLAGIPRSNLKVVAQDVLNDQGGWSGHANVQYLKESDNRWYVVEGTYYAWEAKRAWDDGVPFEFLQLGNQKVEGFEQRYGSLWWSTRDDVSFAQHDMKLRGGVVEV